MSETEQVDNSFSKQIGIVVSLIINVIIFSVIIWWLSSANAYLHDTVQSPDDPRRERLRQLIDVSMGIAIVFIVITMFIDGRILLTILQLCAVIIPSVILSNYLKNTGNPNFERDFPTFWISTVVIFNSFFSVVGIVSILALVYAYIKTRFNLDNNSNNSQDDKLAEKLAQLSKDLTI